MLWPRVWRSQPIWAAWIETHCLLLAVANSLVAAHLGCVNWNISLSFINLSRTSRSPFGLRELKQWQNQCQQYQDPVATHLGCVNWNARLVGWYALRTCRSPFGLRELKRQDQHNNLDWQQVAARLGCVNWNKSRYAGRVFVTVAARLGCVNWNVNLTGYTYKDLKSQPAWAAWIETYHLCINVCITPSQPAWAAWTETVCCLRCFLCRWVAARLGCVNQC